MAAAPAVTVEEPAPATASPEPPRLRRALGREDILPYEGRYAGNPRFETRVQELLALVPSAVDDVGDRLGLSQHSPPRIRIRFADIRTDSNKDWRHVMRAGYETIEGERCCVIIVRTEPFVAREYDLRFYVLHEVVHCWHRWARKWDRGEVPKWVWEGLATWVTGEGERQVLSSYFTRSLYDSGPQNILVPSLDGRPEFMDYALAFMAFVMIEERFGADAVRAFNREILEKPDVESALIRSTQLGLVEFHRQVDDWAAARVRSDLPEWSAYVGIHLAIDKRRFEEAEQRLDAFISMHPVSVLLPLAQVRRAECRIETGRTDGALTDLNESESGDRSAWALNRLRRALRIALNAKLEKWQEVEREAALFLFDGEHGPGMFDTRVYVLLRMARDEIETGTHRK